HGAAALDGHQVLHARDHTEQAFVAALVGADGARGRAPFFDLGQVAARLTKAYVRRQAAELLPELDAELGIGDELEREALSRLLAHTGEAAEQLNDATGGGG